MMGVEITHPMLFYTSHSSMEVMIDVEAERIPREYSRERARLLSAWFVMAAVDESGKAIPAPELIYATEEEQRLFEEGRARTKHLMLYRENGTLCGISGTYPGKYRDYHPENPLKHFREAARNPGGYRDNQERYSKQ